MPNEVITRRRLLMTGAKLTAVLSFGDIAAAVSLPASSGAILTFYDPRFPRSRELASALPEAVHLTAVHADPARLLRHIGSICTRGRRLRVQGVTPESVPFCLEQFALGSSGMCFASRRLDRDLFAWSLTNSVS